MKRRIFIGMTLLAAVAVLIAAFALCAAYYGQQSDSISDELHGWADYIGEGAVEPAYAPELRIVRVKPDGTTQPEAALADTQLLAEASEAHDIGNSDGRRSVDVNSVTHYHARRLSDGSVLHITKTTGSLTALFISILPALLLVLTICCLMCYYAAERLTRLILAPLEDLSRTPVYDELAPFIKNIEQQRQSIAKSRSDLQNRLDTIDAIMENISEGIVLTDASGVILSANRGALRLYGRTESADGRNILELVREPEFNDRLRVALEGGRAELAVERGTRTYRVYFSHVRGGGAIILYLDTTEKESAERLRREFSANVSHELKTPLTSIFGSAELLQSGLVKPQDVPVFYGKIKDEVARLIALVEDIILLSSLDEGGGAAAPERLELREIADETAEALGGKAEQHGVIVTVGGGAVVSANRSMMYELFFNLLDNAIKYNRRGGSAHIEIAQHSGGATITFADTGIGIPTEEQSRVFERFYRIDKSRSKKTGGTGLGLAIVKHIVAAHGGAVKLESNAGSGTAVVITL